jgi:hypothetical protein
MVRISLPEKSATTRGSFKKHSIASRIRWTICYAVLDNMNIDAGPNWFVKTLASNSIDNFLDGEVLRIGSFAM